MSNYVYSGHNNPFPPSHQISGLLYPCITRPVGVLTISEFAHIQRRENTQRLQAVVEECRRRYIYSCRVVGTPDPSFGTGHLMLDLTALLYPWDKLCCWYRNNVFRRQLDFFECPYRTELSRWQTLLLERCLEPIFDDPQRVRLILASVGLLELSHADSMWLEHLYDSDAEPIFGWIYADHDRRPWGT